MPQQQQTADAGQPAASAVASAEVSAGNTGTAKRKKKKRDEVCFRKKQPSVFVFFSFLMFLIDVNDECIF